MNDSPITGKISSKLLISPNSIYLGFSPQPLIYSLNLLKLKEGLYLRSDEYYRAAAGRAGELALPCDPKWATRGGQQPGREPGRRWYSSGKRRKEGAPTQGPVGG